MTQFAQNWTIPQGERTPATISDKAALQEATKILNQRLETLNNTIQGFKAEEQAFARTEQEYLEHSIKVFSNASHLDASVIQQEESNLQSVQNELRRIEEDRLRGPQKADIEADIKRIQDGISASRSSLNNQSTKRAALVQGIKVSEITSLKIKDQDISVLHWVSDVILNVPKADFVQKKFNTEITGKDKGAGFLAKLNALDVANINKDVADTVYARRRETLDSFAVKQKVNGSLSNLLEYIGNVAESKALHNQIATYKVELEQREKDLAQATATHNKVQVHVDVLQKRVEFSKQYINTLKSLQTEISNFQKRTEDRAHYQQEYSNAIQSNAQGLTEFVERTSHASPKHPHHDNLSTENREVIHQFIQEGDFTSQQQQGEQVKEQRIVHTENQFAGEHVTSPAERRGVESQPRTDLQNSEFAKNGKSSCETCTIF